MMIGDLNILYVAIGAVAVLGGLAMLVRAIRGRPGEDEQHHVPVAPDPPHHRLSFNKIRHATPRRPCRSRSGRPDYGRLVLCNKKYSLLTRGATAPCRRRLLHLRR